MRNFLLSILTVLGVSNASAADFPPNSEANLQVIQELLKNGANIRKPHPLEHHFYCDSQASFKALMKKGESLGYKSGNFGEGDAEGNKYWYGDLIKETKLNLAIIDKENSLMLSLAAEFNAEYDGWGTPVIK